MLSVKKNNIPNKKIVIVLVCVVCALLGIGSFAVYRGVVLKQNKETIAEQLLKKSLKELDDKEGFYNDKHIVLRNTSKKEAEHLAAQIGAELRMSKDEGFGVLYLNNKSNIKDVYENEAFRPYLDQMSPDYYAQLCSDESVVTAYSGEIDHTFNSAKEKINLGRTWDVTKGAGTKIAVIDTGIDTDNKYLSGKISQRSFNASEGKVVSDYDISVVEDCDLMTYHGTQVASVIAADYNEETGVGGIAPQAELIVIKLNMDEDGQVSGSDIAFGLAYAIECDVDVINMSFAMGSGGYPEYTKLAVDSDIVCVAAAGNSGSSTNVWPASDENVIGVGTVRTKEEMNQAVSVGISFGGLDDIEGDQSGNISSSDYVLFEKSNYGENTTLVTVDGLNAAFGSEKVEEMPFEGTSCSSAVVSGAAALYLSQNKHQEFQNIVDVLEASSRDLGTPGIDWRFGAGLLDINALVVEEKGTITYDTLTEEVNNTTHIFVRGHSLQTAPEPERNYSVFDGWNYDINCEEEYDNLTDVLYDDLTVYAAWANEDDTDAFAYYEKEDGTLEITSYRGKRRFVSVPAVIEGKTVTSIGERAFYGNNRMRTITLPNGLTEIGAYAFCNCSRLIKIEIPSAVVTIKEYAFGNNPRLGEVVFDSNGALQKIGNYAFAECGSITEIALPAHLSDVNGSTFYNDSNITSITVSEANSVLTADGKALYKKENNEKECVYFAGGIGGNYLMENDTTSIGYLAFAYSGLKNVTLSEQLKTLKPMAFPYAKITEITIPDQVEAISDYAFSNCSQLTHVSFGDAVTSVGANAFYSCTRLSSIESTGTVKTIAGSSFCGCSNLKTVGFINHVESIGRVAFYDCSSIKELTLPNTLIKMEEGAFASCSGIETLVFEDGINLEILDKWVFSGCINLKNVTLPEGLKELGDNLFNGTALETIIIPGSVDAIGNGVFGDCQYLTNIIVAETSENYLSIDNVLFEKDENGEPTILHTYPCGKEGTYSIGDNVKTVADSAFFKAKKLTGITFGENVESVGNQAFYECTFTELVFNNKLKTVGSSAFAFNSLNSVTFGNGVKTVDDGAFSQCSQLETVVLNEGLEELKSSVFYNDSFNEIVLPDSLVTVGPYCFSGCSDLTEIVIPKNLQSLGMYAFERDTQISSIVFADNAVISRLNYGVFADTAISRITLPASIKTMGQEIFKNCQYLQEVTFAENSNLSALAAWTFSGSSSLQRIIFESGSKLQIIEARALEHLTTLSEIDLTGCEQLRTIDNYAFNYCTEIQELIIPQTVEEIGRYAFYRCNALNKLVIPESVDFIGRYAFAGIDDIRIYFDSAVLPAHLQEYWDYGIKGYYLGTGETYTSSDWEYTLLKDNSAVLLKYLGDETNVNVTTVDGYTVSAIGANVLDKNSTVVQLTLPDTVVSLTNYAFYQAVNLKEIVLSGSIERIGRKAFAESGLESISFNGNSHLQYIDAYAFEKTTGLESIIIPASVTQIDAFAFNGSNIKELSFETNSNCKLIGKNAFSNTKLTSIDLPDSLEKIDFHAFEGTPDLTNVNFGSGNLQLYGYAFYNSGLTSVTIPANIEYIGEYCFASCKELLSFSVDALNTHYTSLNDVLFNKSQSKLIQYPAARQESYLIPNETEVLGFGAFEGSKVSAVQLENESKLSTIGYRAFYNCEYLTQINIPDSVMSIDYYAFAYCTRLASVSISTNSVLNGIYEGAFYNCEALESIYVPRNVVEIGEYAFAGCENLSTVTLEPDGKLYGIYEHAFEHAGVKNVDLPKSLNELGDYAFAYAAIEKIHFNKELIEVGEKVLYYTSNIKELEISNIANESFIIKDKLFGGVAASVTKVIFTDTQTIPDSACAGLEKVESVEFTNDVSRIGASAFAGCVELVSISGLDNITVLREKTFENCKKLAQLAGTNQIITFESGCCYNCQSLKGVDFDSARDIQYEAFAYSGIDSAIFSAGLKTIADRAFYQCQNLKTLTIPDLNEAGLKIGMFAFLQTGIESVSLGEGITEIGGDAFWDCNNLTKIELPDSLTTIEVFAFDGCNNLEDISFGSSITVIGNNAFAGTRPRTLILPDTLTSIGDQAFMQDTEEYRKSYVWMPLSIEHIGSNSFKYADLYFEGSELPVDTADDWYGDGSTVTCHFNGERLLSTDDYDYLPDGNGGAIAVYYKGDDTDIIIDTIAGLPVTEVFTKCFYHNDVITNLTLRDSVTKVDDYAFTYCPNLETVSLGNGVKSVGHESFRACEIRELDLGKSIEVIGSYAFADCWHLPALILPDSVTEICDGAFDNTGRYTENFDIQLGSNVKTIGANAFHYSYIHTMVLPDSVISVGERAFYDSYLSSLTISNSLEVIPNMFAEETGLQEIIIPAGVKKIEERAFCKVPIKSIMFEGNQVEEIQSKAFYKNGMKKMVVPEGVKIIGQSAFDSTNTELLVIPDSVTSMSDGYTNSNMVIGFISDTLPSGLNDGWDAGIKEYILNYQEPFEGVDEESGIQYIVSKGKATVTGYTGTASELSLDYIGEYPITIIEEGVFKENNTLEVVHFGSEVTTISDNAFQKCVNLREIDFAASSALEKIGSYAFAECNSLDGIEFPEKVSVIGNSAFSYCQNLGPELNIPRSIVSLGDSAFDSCFSLEKVIFDTAAPLQNLSYTFSYCRQLKEVVLPESITSMYSTFCGCDSLEKLNIPESVLSISGQMFSECPLLEHVDGLIYADRALVGHEEDISGTITVREGTTVMTESIFSGCKNITEILLPGTIKRVPAFSFAETSIRSIHIPDSVVEMPRFALSGLNQLEELSIPIISEDSYSLEYLFGTPGYNTNGWVIPSTLKKVEFSGNVDNFSFSSEQIESVKLKGRIVKISINCPNANEFSFPEYTEIIENLHMAVEKISVPDSVREIGTITSDNLKELSLPEGLERFQSISGAMKRLDIPENIKYIGGINSTCLEYLSLPFAPENLSGNPSAFWGYRYIQLVLGLNPSDSTPESLKTVEITGNPEEVPTGAFYGCRNIKKIILPNTIKRFLKQSFDYCTSLEELNIPEELEEIHENAFRGAKIRTLVLPDSLTYFDISNTSGCDQLQEVTITNPDVVLTGSGKAQTVTIPFIGTSKNEYVRMNLLWDSTTLKNVILLDSCEYVQSDAFAGITGINIYCYAEEAINWPEGWNNGNKVYYLDEWSKIDFLVQGRSVASSLQGIGDPIKLPAKSLRMINDDRQYSYTFVGWDITEDGIADGILTANSRNYIKANAVYDRIPKNVATEVNNGTLSQQSEGNVVWNAESGQPDIRKASVTIDISAVSETNPSSLDIVSDIATLKLNETAINNVAFGNESVTAEITRVNSDLHSSAGEEDALYDLSLYTDGKTVSFANGDDGLITVIIPYEVSDNAVPIVTYVAEDGSTVEMEAEYDEVLKAVSFKTNHFSLFKIGEEAVETATVEFDTNGGELISSITKAIGRTILLPLPEKENAEFISWIDSEGNEYLSGDLYMIDKNETFRAQWSESGSILNMQDQVVILPEDFVYDGTEKTPDISINGLTEGKDYTITYSEDRINAGIVSVTITGIGKYEGTLDVSYEISPANIADVSDQFNLETEEYEYTGKIIKPQINASSLVKNKDYSISYGNNVKPGEGIVILDGLGNYTGQISFSFTIKCNHELHLIDKKDATCTTEGYTGDQICSICGEIIQKGDVISPLGHSFGEWITIDAPGCGDEFIQKRICSGCGFTETTGVEEEHHEWSSEQTIDREASCNADGSHSIHCRNCDAVKDSEVIPSSGHSWDEGVIITEATCAVAGEHQFTCSVCGENKTEIIPAQGHSFGTAVQNQKEASCTEDGYTGDRLCDICGEIVEAGEVIPASGHSFGEWIVDGTSEYRICEICGYQETKEEEIPVFKSASLSLTGEIGVNFNMQIPNSAKLENAYVEFEVNGKTSRVPFSEDIKKDNGLYEFRCLITSIEMGDTITACYHYGNKTSKTISYSAKKYLTYIVTHEDKYSEEMVQLAKQIANYGYYAEQYFSNLKGWSIGIDHGEMMVYSEPDLNIDLSSYKPTLSNQLNGIKVNSLALDLESSTSLYIYLTIDNSVYEGLPTIKIDGKEASLKDNGNGKYAIVIPNIYAHNLGQKHVITIDDNMQVGVSALSVARSVLNASSSSENYKKLMASLYEYYNATVVYRNSK